MTISALAARLTAGTNPCISAMLRCGSTFLAEHLAASGAVGAVTVDMQHGTGEMGQLRSLMNGIAAHGVQPFVRLPVNDWSITGRCLDAGAKGVICPMVSDAKMATDFAHACRYPPMGTRSWGPLNAAIDTVEVEKLNTEVTALAMIETAAGLDNLEEICAVRGIDGIFVGPYDLSLSLGLSPDPSAQTQIMQDALAHICEVARKAGIVAGIHCRDAALLSRMMKLNYNFCTLATDMEYATQGLQSMVAAAVHMEATQPAHDVTSSLLALHNIDADQHDAASELELAHASISASAPRLTVAEQMRVAPEWDHAQVLAMGSDLPSDDLVDCEPTLPPTAEEIARVDAARERLRMLKADPDAWKAECKAWAEALELADGRMEARK